MSVTLREWTNAKGEQKEAWAIFVKGTMPNGKEITHRKTLRGATKRDAMIEEARVRNSIRDGTYVEREAAKKPVMTFEVFADEFMKTYAKPNNKPSTVDSKDMILREHLKPAFGKLALSDITKHKIDAYVASKLAEGPNQLVPKTVNNHIGVLAKMMKVAIEWGHLEHTPRLKLLKTTAPEFDFLTFEEADRLLAAAEEPWRTTMLLAMRTGLRPGEWRALRWEDVDLKAARPYVMVRQSEVNGILGTPKDHESRKVGLSADLVDALKRHRHLRSERVFCHEDGRKLTEPECRAPLRQACRKAGLRQINWYVLRHTFASHLAMRGAPLKAIQELMGHASIEMTLRYAHLSEESMFDAVSRLGPAESAKGAAGNGR